MSQENKELSRMLFEAREIASMYFDVVKIETGKEDDWLKRHIRQIDEYRASKGWSPDGFGNEDESQQSETTS